MSNIDEALKYLTSKQVENDSGGKIKPLTEKQAAGLIGSFIVETGSADLSELDVVERGNNNAGRGLSQYSHARRGPYDQARQKQLDSGKDPNDIKFQLKYMAEEYGGKHDRDGKSLSGWTKSFENIPDDVEKSTKHFTKKFFRPSKPHLDRRIKAAKSIVLGGSKSPEMVTKPSATKKTKSSMPKPTPKRTSMSIRGHGSQYEAKSNQNQLKILKLNNDMSSFFRNPFGR